MSDTTSNHPATITEAISRLQHQLQVVGRGSVAKVQTNNGGNYTYTYSTLADVAAEVYPKLEPLGLAFVCCPAMLDGHYTLVGQLEHVSGEKREGIFPLPPSGRPQDIGSAMTYGRRYLLGCLTGVITADEDDDGQAASPPIGRGQHNGSSNGRTRSKPPAADPESGPPAPPPANTEHPDEVVKRFRDRLDQAQNMDDLVAVASTISSSRVLSEASKEALRAHYTECAHNLGVGVSS